MRPRIEPSTAPLHCEALRFKGEKPPLNVYGSRIATDAANEILCEVVMAIKSGPDDARAVQLLARLVSTHDWVLRVAELHEYLNSLVRRRRDDVVKRIVNGVRPGRRHEWKALLVHLVRATIAAENEEGRDCSDARAARLVADRYRDELGGLSASSINSDYNRYQHEYDRLRAGQFIGKEWLANKKWQLAR